MQELGEFHDMQAAPAFGLERERALKPLAWDLDAAHKYLLHALSKQPSALLQHVQRIHVAIMSEDNAKVHSALLDLYLVLGNKGKAIRAEMLSLAMPQLTEEQVSFYLALERAEDIVIKLSSPHPIALFSVFSQGLEGHFDLIKTEEPCEVSLWCELDWKVIAKLLE